MSRRRPARDTTATNLLLRHVELGETGRLTLVSSAASVDVFLMNGQILSAQSEDDPQQLVRMSFLRGAITEGAAAELTARAEASGPVFGDLIEQVPPALMDPILFDRFRQNLARFCGDPGTPEWHPMRAVFVDNLQMGFDPVAMVEECCQLWDRAHALDLDQPVARGSGRLDNKEQRLVAAKLPDEPVAVSALLPSLPLEPLVARVVIQDMLNSGAIASPSAEVEEDDEDVDDAPTVFARPTPLTEELTDEAPDDASPQVETHAAEAAVETDPAPRAPALRVPQGPRDPSGAGNLTSLSAWLDAAAQVDEDELDFFSDHDYDRGSGDDGAFSTESHNLDRVEVADVQPEVLEADEAPATRFSAPVLSEDEALGKLEVTNQVLNLVVRAFDEAEGNGRGRAVVQLLVDGSPSRFAPLLQDVQVLDNGSLPDREILSNLYGRPSTEHRQLINQALVDIIERALSSAADELPDDQFDRVLESVAGYRQRLGL